MKNYIDSYIRMEEEYGLYDLEVDGFRWWNYIREELYNSIVSFINQSPSGFSKTVVDWKQLPIIVGKCLFDRKYSYRSFKGDYDMLIACHPRRVYVNNSYNSIYTDPITDSFPNSVTIEYPNEGKHYEPNYTNRIFYADRLYYSRAAHDRLTHYHLTEKDREIIASKLICIRDYIKTSTGYIINVEEQIKRIIFFAKRYRFTKNYFIKLFRSIHPKLILEVVYYRFENMVLNEVAHDMGITIVELQHGLTGKYHIAYNFGDIKENASLPDYFFSFSDFWKHEMRLPKNLVTIVSTGFPYYEQQIKRIPKSINRNKIVFLSSGTVGNKLSKIAIELDEVTKNSNLQIIYKLHPGEFADWKQRYPELLHSGIKVIDDAKVDLYTIFSESVAQVGVYSTAIFEGLGYDLQTFILNMGQIEHIQCLIDLKYAVLVNSARDIVNALETKDANESESNSGDYFWKNNALENIEEQLYSLLTRNNKN